MMLINIKLTSSAEHAAFNEAIANSGLIIDAHFDDNHKHLIKQALVLYREKMHLNLTACLELKKSMLLLNYYDKKIRIANQLINML